MVSKFKGICPGTCAPSTKVINPNSFALRQISSTGKISAVALVIWLIKTTLVFIVKPDQNASKNWSLDLMGKGIGCWTYFAPVCLQTNRQVLSIAPYSRSVLKISSPGFNLRLLITVLNAVEGLGVKKKSSTEQLNHCAKTFFDSR